MRGDMLTVACLVFALFLASIGSSLLFAQITGAEPSLTVELALDSLDAVSMVVFTVLGLPLLLRLERNTRGRT